MGKLRIAAELQWQLDMLGVKEFGCFHEPRSCRGLQIDTLTLRNRKRPRIWAANHNYRDADAVEPGDVGDARNAHSWHQLAHTGDRYGWMNRSMSAAEIVFLPPHIIVMELVPMQCVSLTIQMRFHFARALWRRKKRNYLEEAIEISDLLIPNPAKAGR
jgi:hypothetical protein